MAVRDALFRRGSVCILICLPVTALPGGAPLARAAPATRHTHIVNSTLAEPPAHASSIITVNSRADTSGDPNICTLRDAITAANSHTIAGGCPAGTAGTNAINFSLGHFCQVMPCTISLGSALPSITSPLTIDGGGYFPTINGNSLHRVFDIGLGSSVSLSNLRISQGSANDSAGIYAQSTLTLSNVVLAGNHASNSGGAVWCSCGTLNATNSTFLGNGAGMMAARYRLKTTVPLRWLSRRAPLSSIRLTTEARSQPTAMLSSRT